MQRSLGKDVFLILFKAFVVIATVLAIIIGITALYEVESVVSDGTCNVAVFPLEGTILPFYGLIDAPLIVTPSMVDNFMSGIEEEPDIKAVLLEINSPGGTPVAAERIAQRFYNSPLPVVGMIGDIGASGGYMVAAATDYLIASAMSDVGSIGVNMSYVEQSKQNEEDGLTYVQLTTGKFKDAGSPDKPLTEEERELFMRDLQSVHDQFVSIVSLYRDVPREDIATLADGSTMTGLRALDAKLVDGLGGRAEATVALATILGIEASEIVYCEYEAPLIPF